MTGGDRSAVDAVLADPRLARLIVVEPWLAVPDPRRAVLDAAIQDAQAMAIEVVNAVERLSRSQPNERGDVCSGRPRCDPSTGAAPLARTPQLWFVPGVDRP